MLFRRDDSDRWLHQFVNLPSQGRFFQQSLPEVRRAVRESVGGGPLPLRDALKAERGSTLMITAPAGAKGSPDQDDVLTHEGDDVYVGLVCLAPSTGPGHVVPCPQCPSRSCRDC